MKKETGKFYFDGSCRPEVGAVTFNGQLSFSLGIFPMVPTWDGKGNKRGKTVTRVTGPVFRAADVEAVAQRICDMLNNGTVNPAELKRTISYTSDCYVARRR